MDLDSSYTFVPSKNNDFDGINRKETKEYFEKWGLNFSIQKFGFNEPFQSHDKYHLAEVFFKDENVVNSLLSREKDSWICKRKKAVTIDAKAVPCTVLSLNFFNKLKECTDIVGKNGSICQTYDREIDGFIVSDNLRKMLVDEEYEHYSLYSEAERKEFIFRIFQLLVFGGGLCQYEDFIQPYLDVTKIIYKDIIRVIKKENDDGLSIGSTVLEIKAKNAAGDLVFPSESDHHQNVGFLIIDGLKREVITFLHHFNRSW